MLLRLVETADTAGDCEKTGGGSPGAPNTFEVRLVSPPVLMNIPQAR